MAESKLPCEHELQDLFNFRFNELDKSHDCHADHKSTAKLLFLKRYGSTRELLRKLKTIDKEGNLGLSKND